MSESIKHTFVWWFKTFEKIIYVSIVFLGASYYCGFEQGHGCVFQNILGDNFDWTVDHSVSIIQNVKSGYAGVDKIPYVIKIFHLTLYEGSWPICNT